MRAAGSLWDAETPLLRLLLTGLPPGDLKTQCRKNKNKAQYLNTHTTVDVRVYLSTERNLT